MQPSRHHLYEDVLALVLATLLVALGLAFYAEAKLLTGGAVGLSLMLHYISGHPFGWIFFAVNLPFYILAVRRLGWGFTIRTFGAVALLSLFSRLTPGWIDVAGLEPIYAATIGGALMGIGLLMLFRHRAGLGGFNILAAYLQDNFNIRAGYFQLALDSLILVAAFFVIDPQRVALSLAGTIVLNLILGMNHRPGRYVGVS